MATATIRIPEDRRNTLKIIASLERREIKEIVSDLIDEYVLRYKETLDLLSRPDWVEIIKIGRQEVETGEKGKRLNELDD